jgi:YVTN family beta-propeller protein
LSLDLTSQSVSEGSSASVNLSATALNGFSSAVTVNVSGLPTGVSVIPSITLSPGLPASISFSATPTAPVVSQTVTLTGTSGSLTHSLPLTLSITASSAAAPGRTRYVRTDATTEYFGWINQHWMVYDPGTSRLFVTDPISNHIYVLDPVSNAVIGTISVPGAYGIDETPDHSKLYVGTLFGDVYVLDPVTMSVTQRHLASQIGPYGFSALSALVLSDGRLALLGQQGGIPSVDGSSSLGIWNPVDNSFVLYGGTSQVQGLPLPCGAFMGAIGGFTVTADRMQVLLGSIDSDGTLCEVNATTGQGNYREATSFSLYNIRTTPDGKYIIQPSYPTDAVIYDAKTLDLVAQFPVLGNSSSASGFFVSADSKTLYVPTDSIVYAYDIATHQLVGWTSNIYVPPIYGGFAVGPIDSPYLQVTDGTGVFAGPMEEGVGFIDTTSLHTGPVGTQFANGYLVPPTGPASGGTLTQFQDPNPAGIVGDIYFNNAKASALLVGTGTIQATTPLGSPGPADVDVFASDGGMQILPEAFSYGPTILQVTPNVSTAEGGGTGVVLGYGFGPVPATTIPTDLHVTVGGIAATITSFNWNAYNLSSPPYPLQSFTYTVPPGAIRSVDVQVATTSGSATAHGALTYISTVKQFPLLGSTLEQGIYDPHRDVYYFTDVHKIQIFSLSQQKWLTPISITPPSGATQNLWGLGLSPDGTKLVVSDPPAGVIYALSPASPASVKTFTVGSQFGFVLEPGAVAISDAGDVYYTVAAIGGTGADQFFKLNTTTGAIYDYHINSPGLGSDDVYLRNEISLDNSRVFFNDMGYVFSIDTATDKLFSANADPSCCYGDYDLALSSNQTSLEATEYLYDTNLNAKSTYSLNDREILNTQYVYGDKLSPDGRLLFQPSLNGIDVLDGRVGNLLTRIALPVTLSAGYDALVTNGKDNILLAITGANGDGIAVVDLTSLPEPSPLPYLSRVGPRSMLSTRPARQRQGFGKSRHFSRNGAQTALPTNRMHHLMRTLSPSHR